MDTQANEFTTLQDLICEDKIGSPLSLKLPLLEIITKNFSDEQIIGSGGYGQVYKGVLGSSVIAVKKLYSHHAIDDITFQREVDCLMRIRHRNIVWFVGYCAETQMKVIQKEGKNIFGETQEKLLCFEYVQNGSLRNHRTDKPCGLQWPVCYQIIKGVCLGLQYLHEMRIIHLDLKPDNILLDDDMVPKIADFGLSRLLGEDKTHTNTQRNNLGTLGYMAPEYIDHGVITFKTDIYSLGVIIKDIVMGHNTGATTEEVLGTWKTRLERESSQMRQTPLEICYRQIKECIDLSEECRDSKPEDRPTIEKIIGRLEKTEADDLSVVAVTPSVERITYLSKLMEGLRLVSESKQLVPGPSLPAWPQGSGNTKSDKVSWLDTRSGAKCFMLSSRLLHIEWADAIGYWEWTSRPDSRFGECAELDHVYFLAVIGEILTEDLTPSSGYSVYLVYKLASGAVGLKGTQKALVRLYGERTVATSTVSVDPTGSGAAAGVVARPAARPDGWMELKLAEFAPYDKLLLNETKVIVDFREENTAVKKSGLIIEGMEFRPSE